MSCCDDNLEHDQAALYLRSKSENQKMKGEMLKRVIIVDKNTRVLKFPSQDKTMPFPAPQRGVEEGGKGGERMEFRDCAAHKCIVPIVKP